MIKRYRKWRNRRYWNSLDSKVAVLGAHRVRVTQRHGEIIGVELWHLTTGDVWVYTVVR